MALVAGAMEPPSSTAVEYWLAFVAHPMARNWYRTHNASGVDAYLAHRDLAETESESERFFMNVVLCRVLYAHALVAAPRLSLGRLRALAPKLGDPRLGMTGIFLSLSRVLPNEYPLTGSVNTYVSEETTFGRLLDFGLILPRLQQLYAWAEGELAAPGLLSCVENGAMTYAQSISEYSGMQERPSAIVSLVRELLPPSSVSSRKPPST